MILFVMTCLKSWTLSHTYVAGGLEVAHVPFMDIRKNSQGRMGKKFG